MSDAMTVPAGAPGMLSRERIIAGPGFNRWLVPPCALAIHLCIGMGYGFSVFWLPMSKLITNADAVACKDLGFMDMLFTGSCNWSVALVTHTFEIFIAFLGIAAALFGGWVEHVGPRKSGVVAAFCWGGGMILGGIGVSVHQLWLLWLGTGVLGGIGMGIGYITPVSTLIKWFPDRRGMATGFAIMGYGGGALIGSPIAVALMANFASGGVPGVATTMMLMGAVYIGVMAAGAFGFRVAPTGWKPTGWVPPAVDATKGMITQNHVHLNRAWRTPQFWQVWVVLCMNVSAGIGVLAMASPMLQEVFGARLIGIDPGTDLSAAQKAAIVAAAGGLVGLVSFFNSVGRIFWASVSDKIGRKLTYTIFFVLGIVLYLSLPELGHAGLAGLFVVAVCLILTMYGGGFATVPAYLADLFGTQMVGAIHGRLLTAWSVAGVAGPYLITSLRASAMQSGVAKTLVYDQPLHILVGLLVVGLISNLLIRPVNPKFAMSAEELARERSLQHEASSANATGGNAETAARGSFGIGGIIAWLAVGIPFLWGVYIALMKATALF